jgi:hypothetical protein
MQLTRNTELLTTQEALTMLETSPSPSSLPLTFPPLRPAIPGYLLHTIPFVVNVYIITA